MSKAIETVVKMLESLPEAAQERLVEDLRNLIEEARDEGRWAEQFERKKAGLVAAARTAREEVRAGRAEDMDYDKL